MKARVLFAAVAAAGFGTSAYAQPVTASSTITVSLSYTNTTTGLMTPLLPGDSAAISMAVSFTNQDTVGSFSPPVGSFSSGTIRGFGTAFLDVIGSVIVGPGNADGAWSAYGVAPTWDLGNGPGVPNAAGNRVDLIEPGQLAPNPGAVNTTNPITMIWSGVWTPASYTPRTASFVPAGDATAGGFIASLYFKVSASTVVIAYVDSGHLAFSPVSIDIMPAPPGIALFALAPLLTRRRRVQTLAS